MTCEQLCGACDKRLSVNIFDEIGQLSQSHDNEMFQIDTQLQLNLKAMNQMSKLIQNPGTMKLWFDSKKIEFDLQPEE